MVDQSFDWPAFQRLDNAAVVDFLTSVAGALSEQGLISAKETDNLRLVLSGINSAAGARERPLLLELDRQKAEFLQILEARFGTVGLCLNLTRHTLRGVLGDTRRTIADLGTQLVKKSELLFNRPFFIFHGGRCQKQTLYSTVIIDFSETLARSCEMLERALDGLTLMNPSDLAGTQAADLDVDKAIARSLGFKGLITHSLPLSAETEAKREVAQALALVADAAMEISEQLTANDNSGANADMAYGAVAASEWLRAECQRLTLLELPKTESLLAWEVRRRNLAACLASINDALRHVAAASLASFGIGSDQGSASAERRMPEAAKRRLTFDLIVAGVAPAKAKEASEALCRYMVDQKLSAKQILVGELGRIHPSLLPRSLETLATLEGGSAVMAQSGAEKSQTMSRAKRLSETFKRTLVAAAPTALLLLAICTTGCGLKTRPTSDVLEPRPDIPFRAETTPAEPPKAVDAPVPGTENQAVPWTPVGQPKTDGGKQP